jgi:pimeloyl-ACP methyl ester carboxylesterase
MLTYDLRGHGKSDMPETGYTSVDMASDLAGLMDRLKLKKAHLIGHSFGGEVALQMAIRYPGRVEGVVLADARVRALQPVRPMKKGPSWSDVRDKLQQMGVTIPQNRHSGGHGETFFQEIANSPWPGAWNSYNPNGSQAFGPFGLGRYGPRSVQHWVRLYSSTSAEQDLASPAGITERRLREIEAPVLAVYGDRSGFMPTMRQLARLIPDCETRIVPGVGHMLPVVAPRVFVQYVRAFIGALATRRRGRARFQ